MASDQQSYARARNAALGGLVIQAALFAGLFIAYFYSGSPAIFAMTWHALGGIPLWIILWMLFHQHRLERIEALEAEQLSRSDASTATIFSENAEDLQLARRRLENLYKWGVPIVSMLIAVYLTVIGLLIASTTYTGVRPLFTKTALSVEEAKPILDAVLPTEQVNAGVVAVIMASAFFVCFIFARYAAGMTKITEWSPLRGGAGYLMGNFLVSLLVFVGALFALFGNRHVLAVITVAVPVIITVLGIEIILAQLLTMYRPRKPGEIPRAAFDSRLLGMLTSPKSLGKAITDTINYQFGFEVSRSWFYQLLSSAIAPLIAFGIVVLFAMSTIVIVPPDSQGIRMTFGGIGENAEPLQPGIHFKWPWPIGAIEVRAVAELREISVGSSAKGVKDRTAILWTNDHVEGGKEEYLICSPPAFEPANDYSSHLSGFSTKTPATQPGADKQAPSGANLIGGQVAVQYRIKNVLDYSRATDEPVGMLSRIVERRASAFFVTRDIDSLLGQGRDKEDKIGVADLHKQVQADCDEQKLGLEIVFVGLSALHPPKDTATAFHEQIGVLQERQSAVETAEKDRINILGAVAGSAEQALAIRDAIRKYDDAKRALGESLHGGKMSAEERQAAEKRIADLQNDAERLLMGARGQAAQIMAEASKERWERFLAIRSQVAAFDAELDAYRRAPEFYKMRKFLDVMADGMAKPRKYILTTEAATPPTFRIDLKESSSALGSLLDGPR